MNDFFEEQVYLLLNPLVAEAIIQGKFASALEHFELVGKKERLIASTENFILDQATEITNLKRVLSEAEAKIAVLSLAIQSQDVHILNIEKKLSSINNKFNITREAFSKCLSTNPNINNVFFNAKYYSNTNPDVSLNAKTKIDLIAHYLFHGIHEGRQPLPPKSLIALLPTIMSRHGGLLVVTKKSLAIYRNTGLAGLKSAVIKFRTNDLYSSVTIKRINHEQQVFDENWYLAKNPDVVKAIAIGHYKNGEHHYEEFGKHEGRSSNEAEAKLKEKNSGNNYQEWLLRYDTLTPEKCLVIKERIALMKAPPLISVVMPVYNPPLAMLEAAIKSVQGQLYSNWELCIADDASQNKGVHKLLKLYATKDKRIKVVFRKKNGHISAASNSALTLVKGQYIALLDNDDLLTEHALYWLAEAMISNPNAGLIYSDEDKIDQAGKRYDPYFKPDWNPDLFLSHNMICHLGAYSTSLVKKLGGFREGLEGAQDYDLALRCSEQLTPQQIVHIPRVLYHWRSHPGSTAQAGSEKNYALLAGERALNDHFLRIKVPAKAELLDFGMYKASYDIPIKQPLVSLIIPTFNGLALIKQCIDSIVEKTTYKNYEIIVVDNNSDNPEALAYFESLEQKKHIRVIRDQRPFNFSALNNTAVKHARGEYIGLINNDIEVISPDWLTEMVSLAIQPGVGCVGARLWYPNNTLQHGGVVIGIGGVAGHSHKNLYKGMPGYFSRAQLIQTISAVTAACLIIKKSIYQEVEGLDEVNLTIAFNDIDFCLRVQDAGYRNIWTPYAELYHHESATRGFEDTPEKQQRFSEEVRYMKERWGDALMKDPAYSPNLTLDREDFSYSWPPRVEN
jgi:glycosyltransferase involved in cell wall biosynthesis